MKFTTRTEHFTEPHTRDGITVDVPRTREVPVPVMPRDWDQIALRTVVGITIALTIIVIVWSTYSIGELLGGTVGYAAAVVFDVSWIVCLLLEYLARYDAEKRSLPTLLGWILMGASAGALFWHGAESKDWALAVTGAGVSVIAKVLWWAVGRHVGGELSVKDAAWVKAQKSEAHAKLAISAVRREVARVEDHATAQLLAMEASRRIPEEIARRSGMEISSLSVSQADIRSKAEVIREILADRPEASGPDVAEAALRLYGKEITTQDVSRVRHQMRQRDESVAPVVELRKHGE